MMRGTTNNNDNVHRRYSGVFKSNVIEKEDDAQPHSLGRVGKLLFSYNSGNDDPEKLKTMLRLYSISLLGTSTFFWVWAIYNTYHLRNGSGGGGFDLGILSFFGTGVSSALLLRSALGGKCCGGREGKDANKSDEVEIYGTNSKQDQNVDRTSSMHSPPGKHLRAFAVLTQLTVVANYMLGILFAFTAGPRIYVYFATYCVVFSLTWLVAAYIGWVLMRLYKEAVIRTYGEDAKGPPSSLFRSAFLALTNLSGVQSNYDDDDEEEEDVVNEELRSLYEGRGTYSNN